jgi:hypothetical protein
MRRSVLGTLAVLAMCVVPVSASPTAVIVHRPFARFGVSRATAYSTNWSGYAAQATTFTDVRGSWTQPSVACTTRGQKYSSFWVGLDGYNSNSVEQIGTDSDCTGKNSPVYLAWYEMYPAGSVSVSGTVAAGDHIAAEVSASGTSFTLSLTNHTRGWTFTKSLNSSAAVKSSAEWVAEAPSSCFVSCTTLPLADFGTMSFTAASATGTSATGAISSFNNDKVVMVTSGGKVRAMPSVLNSGGDSFSDTWYHS